MNGVDMQREILNKPKPNMNFVAKDDVNQVLCGAHFSKAWVIQNNGPIKWPDGTTLEFQQGERMEGPVSIPVPTLMPGQEVDMALNFRAPVKPGQYYGCWRMFCTDEYKFYFGEPIWVLVNAVPNQGNNQFNPQFGSNPQGNPQGNPFNQQGNDQNMMNYHPNNNQYNNQFRF